MKNYIVINGKKAELTKEQLEKLGIKPERNNPFDRVNNEEDYFVVREDGGIADPKLEMFDSYDNWHYNNVAYFNDEEFAKQISLKWLLNRKLEKYAWDNDAEDGAWGNENEHYSILYTPKDGDFFVGSSTWIKQPFAVYFSKGETAENAIKDVIEPFMEEHPEFRW